jgi:hypothetical protein
LIVDSICAVVIASRRGDTGRTSSATVIAEVRQCFGPTGGMRHGVAGLRFAGFVAAFVLDYFSDAAAQTACPSVDDMATSSNIAHGGALNT